MGDASSLLLYLYLAFIFCHAAGAGGGGLEHGLLGPNAAGRITSLRVRSNARVSGRQDGVMPLRGGADFRAYEPSQDDSDEEDEEKLPPQLDHDIPWKIDTVDKDDMKDGGQLARPRDAHHDLGWRPALCYHVYRIPTLTHYVHSCRVIYTTLVTFIQRNNEWNLSASSY